MELNDSNVKKLKELILFAAIVAACLWKYDDVRQAIGFVFHVAFPFILGGAIAFVLNVPVNFLERRLFPPRVTEKSSLYKKAARPLSLLAVVSGAAGIAALVLFGFVPRLGRTFVSLGENIQIFLPRIQKWIAERFPQNAQMADAIVRYKPDLSEVWGFGMSLWGGDSANMLDRSIAAVRSILSGAAVFFIAFVFALYVLLQKERLKLQAKEVLFAFVRRGRAEAALEVLALTYETFSGFLTGQCVEAVILGSMFVVSMWLLRLPYALLTGIIIAFTALIPVFGAFVGCAAGVFLIFVTDPVKALVFLVLFIVLQQIEGNFIYPHVVGNSVGLPSIWVLAAVSLGASLMGVAGMLLFIPVVSVLYALFREIVYLKLRQRGIRPEDIGGD